MTAGKLQQLVKEVAPLQLGSLGGGNHFIEGCREEGTGRVWLTVHSGSRHTGLQIAMHHAGVAAKLDERKGWKGLPDLGYLPLDSEEGRDYVTDMNWAIDFALENRFRMMEVMLAAFEGDMLSGHNECFFRRRPLEKEDDDLLYPALLNCSKFTPQEGKPLSWICTAKMGPEEFKKRFSIAVE